MMPILRFSLWLAVATSFTVSNSFVSAQQSLCELRREKPCGDEWVNPTFHFCCEEKLYKYRNDISTGPTDCCNGRPYNSFAHVCCAGCLHARNDTKLRCCWKEVYSTRIQICCGGVVSRKDHFIQCCGSNIYNRATHMCCRDVTYPVTPARGCCGASTYDVTTHVCCSDCIHAKRYQHTLCCGRVTYNHRTQICCHGVLFDRSGSLRCCEQVLFNPTTHICCRRHVFPQKFGQKHTRCCFNYFTGDADIFDYRYSRCCNLAVVTSRVGPIASGTLCCSNLLYLPDSYTACCSHVTYNPMTHACCRGKPVSSVNLKQRSHQCCNGLYYDSTKAKCCCGKVIYTDDIKGTGCCDGKLFKTPGVCCQNKWFPRYTRCCGPNPLAKPLSCCDHRYGLRYDFRESACCDGLLVPVKRLQSSYGCCGIVPYPNTKYFCCWGCIHRRRIGISNACCAKTAYNPATHICCHGNGTVHPRTLFNQCCTNQVPFNTATHRCCHHARVIARNQLC